MAEVRHPIKVVVRDTGLSPHVIRVWEKRYATVQPIRSRGNQRLYSDADIERLKLLRRIVASGRSISTVSGLSVEQLRKLAGDSDLAPADPETVAKAAIPRMSPTAAAPKFVADAFAAVSELDTAGLERILDEASIELGQIASLNQVISPLVQRIGEAWREGTLKVVHEHLASAVIRTFLGQAARSLAVHGAAPTVLVTTPAGQLHELGAVLAAASAAAHGWRVTFLGPSLPVEEIVGAVRQSQARAVALSIVHPGDDPDLSADLKRLRRLLPASVSILVGGRAAHAYRETLEGEKISFCESLDEFISALDRLRRSPS